MSTQDPIHHKKRSVLPNFKVMTLGSFCSIALFGAIPMGNQPQLYADRVETLYDIRNADSLKPHEYKINTGGMIPNLFPVPQSNTVGTNSIKNAITLLSFDHGKLKDKHYFKNAVSGMSPSGQYMPLFSQDAIGYGMSRGFTIFDFTHNKFRDFTIFRSISKDMDQVRATDASKNLFLFQSTEDNPHSEDWTESLGFLSLFDLSQDKPRLVKRIPLQNHETWEVYNKNVFIFDFEADELRVLDSELNPSTHPLVEITKKNKGTVSFVVAVPHPTLPFAILYGGGYRTQYVCWNQTFRDEKIKSLFGKPISTLYYSFSPDGKWVIFLHKNSEPKRSYIMPVSEKYPNYLGSPILLEGDYFDRDKFAWTNHPVSLVGASNGKLLRYDLTKEGHPETGDKPTFWDYVVDRDLEKLRKAGKQGLGQKPPAGP